MISTRISLLAVFTLLWGCAELHDQTEVGAKAPVGAKAAATVFLSSLDSGDAARTYDLLSNHTKTLVTKEQVARWIEIRKRFGPVTHRLLLTAQSTDHMNLEPDGTYEILDYHTTYSLKKDGWERVVLTKYAEGWQVSGFHYR